jgi:BirA family transcriptional regulator, biotin operon repressor / biotin---[acetyl-CoA-carboxylase] ligase
MINIKEFHYNTVASTMEIAREKLKEPSPHGTLIIAGSQTSGRGRYGRVWESNEGNFFSSLILQPDCDIAKASELSFVMTLVVGELIKKILPSNSEIVYKWPNDVLVNNKKISGILLEADVDSDGKLSSIIVGCGINLIWHPELDDYEATDCSAEGAVDIKIGNVTKIYKELTSKFYDYWVSNGFYQIRKLWLEQAKGLNQEVTVKLRNEKKSGIFKDITIKGELVLESNQQTINITSGEVFFE